MFGVDYYIEHNTFNDCGVNNHKKLWGVKVNMYDYYYKFYYKV